MKCTRWDILTSHLNVKTRGREHDLPTGMDYSTLRKSWNVQLSYQKKKKESGFLLSSRKDKKWDVLPSFSKHKSQDALPFSETDQRQDLLPSSRKDKNWDTRPSSQKDTSQYTLPSFQNKVVHNPILQKRQETGCATITEKNKSTGDTGILTEMRKLDTTNDHQGEVTKKDKRKRETREKMKHQDIDWWRPKEGTSYRHSHRSVFWGGAGKIRGVVRNWAWQEWSYVHGDA